MNHIIKSFSLCFLLFFGNIAINFAQIKTLSVNEKLDFSNYLKNNKKLIEANFVLQSIKSDSTNVNDSVNYLLGWNFYTMKKLDSSAYYLALVSNKSNLFNKSCFFAAYNNFYLNNFHSGKSKLEEIQDTTSITQELKHLQLAGVNLLMRDFNGFEKYQKLFSFQYASLMNQEKNLENYYSNLKAHKPKSVYIAGMLSTVVPGLGKIYTGKKGTGIANFLQIGMFGLIAHECYKKDGINSFSFVSTATITSIFYIANIWGSVISAKISNDEFNKEINNRILLDMQIPIRNIFN